MCHIIEIYVVCPALCKPGVPYGKWIDATKPLDEIQDEIKAMLADSPTSDAKTFKVRNTHDPTGYNTLSGIDDIDRIHEIAAFVEEHGNLGAALLNKAGRDVEHATSLMENAYCGQFESTGDYVYGLIEDIYNVDYRLMNYIDREKFWRDLEVEGYIAVELGFYEFHIFSAI